MNYEDLTNEEKQEILINQFGVSQETIDMVTNINGTHEETFNDILYVASGYRSFEQLAD